MARSVLPRLCAALFAAVVLTAAPAFAHEGHSELPDGFRAELSGFVDESEAAASLDGVELRTAAQGIGLTVENATGALLELPGEQAGEPLLRVTADKAWVNQASPQAKDVRGATVDPAATAELLDLVWQRAEADWVPLPAGGEVFVLDHRSALGHPPVRSEFATGDEVSPIAINFTYDGTPYRAVGSITAVAPTAGGGGLVLPLAGGAAALLALAGTAVVMVRLRRGAAPTPA